MTRRRVSDAVTGEVLAHVEDPTARELTTMPGGRAVLRRPRSQEVRLLLGDVRPTRAGVVREVVVDGWRFELLVEDAAQAELRERASRGRGGTGAGGPLQIRAVIPGRVVSVSVERGDRVTVGQPLLVIEAMKMQNELRAPRDGSVEQVAVDDGVTVERGDLLLVLT